MSTPRPHILLIVVDQWRADALGLAGHPVVETPNLDFMFRDGYRFNQAYSAVPSCIPARAALLTGQSQRRHGRVGYRDRIPWTYEHTLPGELAKAGYHTQCVGKMHVFPARNLMGFHHVVLHDGYLHTERCSDKDYALSDDYIPWLRERVPNADIHDAGVGCNGYTARPWPYDETLHPTHWVTSQGIDFLRRRDPSKPFFLKLSYHRPHPPLDPPRSFLDRYLHRELPKPPVGDWAGEFVPRQSGYDSPTALYGEAREYARKAYYAHLTHIDFQLNRVFHALYEHRVMDNTLILFVSDHGEMLFDHHRVAKGKPYDSSARVPFMLKLPRSMEPPKRKSSDAVIELRDIMPTLLEAAGAPIPDSVDGRSVLPLLRGEASGLRKYLHGEHVLGDDSNQWLNDGRELYVWFSQTGEEQLFEIAGDPTNLRNLAPAKPERVAFWRERLMAELKGREEGFVQDGKLVAGRPVQPWLREAGLKPQDQA